MHNSSAVSYTHLDVYKRQIYGATSSSVLMEYLSPEEILVSSEEDLIAFLAEKSRNRIKEMCIRDRICPLAFDHSRIIFRMGYDRTLGYRFNRCDLVLLKAV